MAGVIGLRGPDILKRDALRGYKVVFEDADRPYIRPHTGAPILTVDEGTAHVTRHVFGFSRRFSSFNARADKLAESKMWSSMFAKAHHHGICPVSYFVEWADLGHGKKPFRIERADGAAMAVPALVGAYWEDRSDRAFALVTIDPNPFVRTFHDRMIAQLSDSAIDIWLHPENHSTSELYALLAPPPNGELVARPVAADVGKAKFDDPSALEPIGPAVTWEEIQSGGARGRETAGTAPMEADEDETAAAASGTTAERRVTSEGAETTRARGQQTLFPGADVAKPVKPARRKA
ncbi:MAG: SOS response-associated peptidase [Thermoplasmatota archaeon]